MLATERQNACGRCKGIAPRRAAAAPSGARRWRPLTAAPAVETTTPDRSASRKFEWADWMSALKTSPCSRLLTSPDIRSATTSPYVEVLDHLRHDPANAA
jgi:hypothetical protein